MITQEQWRNPEFVAQVVLAELHQRMLPPGDLDPARASIPYDVGGAVQVQDYVDLNELVLRETYRAGYPRGDASAEYVLSDAEGDLAEQVIALIDVRLAAEAGAVREYVAAPMAASEFVRHLIDSGVGDAELADHGLGPVPWGHLQDGDAICVSSFDGGLVQGEPLPPLVSMMRYESPHVSAEQWGEGKGLDFNDPCDAFDGTPAQVLAKVQAWVAEGTHIPAIGSIVNRWLAPIVYGMIEAREYPLTGRCVCGRTLHRDSPNARWYHYPLPSPLTEVPAPEFTTEPAPDGGVRVVPVVR